MKCQHCGGEIPHKIVFYRETDFATLSEQPPAPKIIIPLTGKATLTLDGYEVDLTNCDTAQKCADAITAQTRGYATGFVTPQGAFSYTRRPTKSSVEIVSRRTE